MTEQAMRIAIAEACGLTAYDDNIGYGFVSRTGKACNIPDYLNDLNAMHEAVLTLEVGHDGSQADDYQQCLFELVNPGVHWSREQLYDVAYLWKLINATAAQHCEAFLQTLGLWKD